MEMLFDTHAHYDHEDFSADRDQILSALPALGVGLVINAGCDMPSSRNGVILGNKYDFVYSSAGIHPHDTKDMTDDDLLEIEQIAKNPKVVAIGEIGLDYYYDLSPRETQIKRFRDQLEVARAQDMPVIIHEREACADCLRVLKEFPGIKAVYHCYSGSLEIAKELIKMGFNLSFTGVITFTNAVKPLEVLAWLPKDRFMIETDSPYLSPVPMRGKRNDSRNLTYIAEKAAEIRGITPEELAAITTENGKKFFGICPKSSEKEEASV